MNRLLVAFAVLLTLCASALAQPARPPQETRKVDGTDGVYIFRNGNHQAMFVVTPEGVIATDPIAYGRPTGGQDYVNAIRAVTNQPIRYLVYSHHHFDHIAGGRAFKEAGATIVAHRRAKERLEQVNDPATPLPDEVVEDAGRVIRLGGKVLELFLCRAEPLRQHARHAPAAGPADLPRRPGAGGRLPGARHD
jgi:glyoxylase-like metal-dependent hydrolase (beta-lactamase superfamily II)